MANDLQIQMIFSSLTTESMYYLLVIYVLSAGNLYTCILQYNHDHILTEHSGQNKTLKLVCHRYFWPSLYTDV